MRLRTSTHALASSLACEKLFSAFKRRRVRAEKRWNVGITRARMWACVRAGTRTRPAFDCILCIYSGRRVYARRARFASFCFLFSPLFLFSHFLFRARTRWTAVARIPRRDFNVYRLINDTRMIPVSGIYATSIFGAGRRNPDERGANERKMCENPDARRTNWWTVNVFTRRDLRNRICIAMKSERTAE